MADGKNYDDLKAKLGLKTSSNAAGASSDPDKTPAGGFDLGLERGAAPLDESEAEIVRQADQRAQAAGGPDLMVKESSSTRTLKLVLVLVAVAVALGVGWMTRGISEDRFIQDTQRKHATTVLERLQKLKAVGGEVALTKAIDDHVTVVSESAKKMAAILKAEEVTDALLKQAKADLEELRDICRVYIAKGPRLDPGQLLDKAEFNLDATKAVLTLSRAVNDLYYASLSMAREDQIFVEFQQVYDPKSVVAKAEQRAWQAAHTKDKEGRLVQVLVGVSLEKDDKGAVVWKKTPVKVPAGYRFKAGDPRHIWQVKVTYDNPEAIGKKEALVNSDVVVVHNLQQDLTTAMRKQLGEHHKGYRFMIVRRLHDHVKNLEKAANAVVNVRKNTLKKLEELSGNTD